MTSSRPSRPPVGQRRQEGHAGAIIAVLIGLAVAVGLVVLVVLARDDGENPAASVETPPGNSATTSPSDQSNGTPGATQPPGGAACGDILAPMNKQNALRPSCEPTDLQRLPDNISDPAPQRLRAATVSALQELLDAASRAGFRLFVASSYRSYDEQARIFDSAVRGFGLDYAERTSARAGHSEHQLGTTADVTTFDSGHALEDFIGTPAASWLAENSWRYGFIVSYPPGKRAITGYEHEPWHIRYVGKDVARQVHESGLTLHEFLLR